MNSQPIFLIESPHGWGGVWQRPHHIFRLLGEEYPCYYVATRYLRDAWLKKSEYLRGRYLAPARHLTVREIILLNGERLPLIRSYNISHLARTLNGFARVHPADRKILWLYDPHQVDIIDRVDHDLLVYDIMDEYTGFPWSPSGIAHEEERLLARADIVIAGTYALYESKKPLATHGTIDWILSAVDFDFFHQASFPGEIPSDLNEIRSNYTFIAGYYGVVDMRIDIDLLAACARHLPEWAFVLIGPLTGEKPRRLLEMKIPNIFLLGRRHYSTLPAYTRGFDACIIPFVLDNLTRHINPTKILEYCAAGKPVITIPIPDVLRFYQDCVTVAHNASDFVQALKDASSPAATHQKIIQGLEIARTATWTQAVQRIKDKILNP